MRSRTALAAVIGLALGLGGCSVLSNGGVPAKPAESASPVIGGPSASDTTASAATAQPSGMTSATSSSTAGSVTPSPNGVVLSGAGITPFPFGAPVIDVEPYLRGRLGTPTRVFQDTGCPMNPLWTKTMVWKGLVVSFEATTAKKTTRLALSTWQLRPAAGVPAGVTLIDGLPVRPTFAELRVRYQGTKVVEELGWYLLELPNGITYIGENRTRPSALHGGPIQWCE